MKRVALVKDRNGFWELYKPLLEKYNYEVSLFDLRMNDDQNLLLKENWDIFIWRAKHTPKERNPAKRFINLMCELGTKTFPNWKSFAHYDDKISQSYLLQNKGIPIPPTYVFYNKEDADKFISSCEFPLIFKSAHGAGSSNVGLIKNYRAAKKYVKQVFGKGIKTFFAADYQKDYAYFQKFLKGNEGDFRLICFGDKVEGFYRNNRKDSPFASGSSDFLTKDLPEDLLNFVYDTNRKLGYDLMSYDLIVTEMSVIYGDRKFEIYNELVTYKRTIEGNWEKYKTDENHYVRVLEEIILKWEEND